MSQWKHSAILNQNHAIICIIGCILGYWERNSNFLYIDMFEDLLLPFSHLSHFYVTVYYRVGDGYS